jgi:prepilin-type N-terminal cleavage/methylation domain-containing protein
MKREARQGFTLVETVVAMALSVLLMLALASMIQYFYKENAGTLLEWRAVSSGQGNLSRAMGALREASALTSAGTSSLSYLLAANGTTTAVTYAPTGAAFTYYNASGTALTSPINLLQVRSVLAQVAIKASAAAPTTTLLGGAALPNLATTTP